MKTIGLIVAMLFSVTSWGATPAKVPSMDLGGFNVPIQSNLKMLHCSTRNNFDTCRDENNAQYVVPGSSTFRIIGVFCTTFASSGQTAKMYRGTTALINSTTCPGCSALVGHPGTGPGDIIHNVVWCASPVENNAGDPMARGKFLGYNGLEIPGGDYIHVHTDGGTFYGTLHVYGYEETP